MKKVLLQLLFLLLAVTIMMDIIADFSDFTTLGLPIGDYEIQYSISSNFTDPNLSNNDFSRIFRISENSFAFGHELTQFIYPKDEAYDEGEFQSWAFGSLYKFDNLPLDATLGTFQFYVGNPQDFANESIYALIYTWNEDSDGNQKISQSERELIAWGHYQFTGNEVPEEAISIDILIPLDGSKWLIEQNKTILFTVESISVGKEPPAQIGVDANYFQQEYWTFNPQLPGVAFPYFGIFAGMNHDLTVTQYDTSPSGSFIGGLNGSNHYLPICASFEVGFPLPINERTKENNGIKLLENPVENIVRLQFENEDFKPKFISIYNTSGQAYYHKAIDSQDTLLQIPVSSLPNGTYHILVSGKGGQAATTFIKI